MIVRIVDRKILVNGGFILALVILAVIGWLSYTAMKATIISEKWERHSLAEMRELGELLSTLRDVESMNRGFIITGNEKYLEPYHASLTLIEQKLVSLRGMEQVNPRQQKRHLDIMTPLIREKLAMVEATIELRRTKGFQAASQAVMTDRGKRVMDEIDMLVAESQDDEGRILLERELVDIEKTGQSIRMLFTGNILSLILLCTVFILLKREIARRVRTEDELREHRDHLDQLIQERTAQLVQAKSEAEIANCAKSEFLENMSHEMRTPLTGIMGVIDLMLTERLTDQHRRTMEMARSSAETLNSLINDILDYSRISTGMMIFENRPFDLRSCVGSVVSNFKNRAERKGLALMLELDDRLPPLVVGDEKRFRQVLENLLRNAVKFTANGAISVTVQPEQDHARANQEVIQVVVRDTGTGIPAEYLENIFEMFSQADTSSTKKFGGAGLGLALSKQIVEKMGGMISGESRPGEGSVFSFTLPFSSETTATSS
jgi:signal transduction histidine kinase